MRADDRNACDDIADYQVRCNMLPSFLTAGSGSLQLLDTAICDCC